MDDVGKVSVARRIARQTVWHPDAISPDEWVVRNLLRVWLPLFDVLVIIGGVLISVNGSESLSLMLAPRFIGMSGALLAGAGFACFVGVILPKAWRFEILAKIFLLVLLATAWAFALAVGRGAAFETFVICLSFPVILFRLQMLGDDIKERKASEKGLVAHVCPPNEGNEGRE